MVFFTIDIQTLAKFKQSFIFFLTIGLPNKDMLSERKIPWYLCCVQCCLMNQNIVYKLGLQSTRHHPHHLHHNNHDRDDDRDDNIDNDDNNVNDDPDKNDNLYINLACLSVCLFVCIQ